MKAGSSRAALCLKVGLVCLGTLALGIALGGSRLAGDCSRAVRSRAHELKAHFAIADWDGDSMPDLATVEAMSRDDSPSNYWIRVRFSARRESAIPLRAPLGGLRLAAKDVNGDDNVDLVVSSDLDSRFIQILLNDGHGNFSLAEPGSYSVRAEEESNFWQGPVQTGVEQLSLAQTRPAFDGADMAGSTPPVVLPADSAITSDNRAALSQSRQTCRGRAPPSLVSIA